MIDLLRNFLRRPKAPQPPRLILEGHSFAPGGAIAGHAVVGPEPGDAVVELCRVTSFREHFTKLYDQPVAVCSLRAGCGDEEQPFVLSLPAELPAPSAVFVEDGEPGNWWEVTLVVNRVGRASHRVSIG